MPPDATFSLFSSSLTSSTSTSSSSEGVALLATRLTYKARLYHDALAERNVAVLPNGGFQSKVDALIQMVKAQQPAEERFAAWNELLTGLRESGEADAVLIACTDLNPAISPDPMVRGQWLIRGYL